LKNKWLTHGTRENQNKNNSRKCPLYKDCLKKLTGKAERLGRKPKKPPCKLHCDQMAKRYPDGAVGLSRNRVDETGGRA